MRIADRLTLRLLTSDDGEPETIPPEIDQGVLVQLMQHTDASTGRGCYVTVTNADGRQGSCPAEELRFADFFYPGEGPADILFLADPLPEDLRRALMGTVWVRTGSEWNPNLFKAVGDFDWGGDSLGTLLVGKIGGGHMPMGGHTPTIVYGHPVRFIAQLLECSQATCLKTGGFGRKSLERAEAFLRDTLHLPPLGTKLPDDFPRDRLDFSKFPDD